MKSMLREEGNDSELNIYFNKDTILDSEQKSPVRNFTKTSRGGDSSEKQNTLGMKRESQVMAMAQYMNKMDDMTKVLNLSRQEVAKY